MITCGCPYDDDADDGVITYEASDFAVLNAKRGRRCKSCEKLINVGATVLMFERARYASGRIEEAIFGEGAEIELPPHYLCESCGDLYLSLTDAGYCVDIDKNIKQEWEKMR